MKINTAYSALGEVFEYLNDDCGYEQWSQYLIEKLRACGVGNKGLDIGCGNGYFTRALYRAGYDVKGMDISPQMLSSAVELGAKSGCKTEFLLGDITKLNINFRPDFITAVNDCINYIPPSKLGSAFRGVYRSLSKDGLFYFDISSERHLRETVGNNIFSEDRGDIVYIWYNQLVKDSVEMDITLFRRRGDGAYVRADERQTQYIYSETQLCEALQEVGFDVSTEGHLGSDKLRRITFICKKH